MAKLIFIAAILALAPAIAWSAPAELVRVISGDTLVARVRGKDLTLRLAGIDCPDLQEHGGLQAKAYTEQALSGGSFSFSSKGRDRKYRPLATITTSSGKILNIKLIQLGLARANPVLTTPLIKKEEEKARAAKLGIWADPPQPQPAPPAAPQPPVQEQTPLQEKGPAKPKQPPPQPALGSPEPPPVKAEKGIEKPVEAERSYQLRNDLEILQACEKTWKLNQKLSRVCFSQQYNARNILERLQPDPRLDQCLSKWKNDYREALKCYEDPGPVM